MITYPITLPATPGPVTMEWGALTVGGRNVSPYTLGQETFEWPGNRWRVSVQLPRMTRAQADAWVAALTSLYGVGTFLLGPAGAGKTAKGTAGGLPIVSGAGQTGKTLAITGLTGILKAADYFAIGGENRLLYSQAFENAVWAINTVTRPTANTIVAPDSTTTAEALVATAVNSYVYQTFVPLANGQIYTFSVWLKVPSGTKTIDIQFVASTAFSYVTNCALTSSWQRFSVSGLVQGPQTGMGYYVVIGGGATTWDSGEVDAWGAQLEIGSNVNSYIPTISAIATCVQRLYMNMSDQIGNPCTLDIFPRLRESPLDGAALVLASPQGLFRLAGNEPKWDVDAANLYGLSFEAEEAF